MFLKYQYHFFFIALRILQSISTYTWLSCNALEVLTYTKTLASLRLYGDRDIKIGVIFLVSFP